MNARCLLEEIDYPGGEVPVPIAATPVRLGETLAEVRRRAPQLGEHTDEVLAELSFTTQEIAVFRDEGAI